MRKSASGPVGGPRASYKIGGIRRKGGVLRNKLLGNQADINIGPKPPETEACRQAEKLSTEKENSSEAPGSSACSRRMHSPVASHTGNSLEPILECSSASCISKSRSESFLPQRKGLDIIMGKLAEERCTLQSEQAEKCLRQSRRLRSAGSIASNTSCKSGRYSSACSTVSGRSSSYSSCPSQAVRSSILSLELHDERERRQAAEAELEKLKAEFAKMRT